MNDESKRAAPYRVHFLYEPIMTLSRTSLERPTLESALPILSHTLLRKLLSLTDCHCGVHLFVNFGMSEFDILTATNGRPLRAPEGQARFVRCRHYPDDEVYQRRKPQPLRVQEYPLGSSKRLDQFLTSSGEILADVNPPDCWALFKPIWAAVSAAVENAASSLPWEQGFLRDVSEELSSLKDSDRVLICRFDLDEYDLGVFFAWGEIPEPLHWFPDLDARREHLDAWRIALLTALQVRYSFQPTAYLPSFARSEHRSAVLLFVDIRGFTSATEMARFTGQSESVVEFLQDLVKRFSEIVMQHEGRIERVRGDGVVAVFGEYDNDALWGCGCALGAATEMYKAFQGFKESLMNRVYGPQYRTQFNEDIEVDLGISLNYGEVTFGYFGSPPTAEYAAVGDHANFGSRLADEARCYDENLGRERAPLLVSQTVFSILDQERDNQHPCKKWFKARVDQSDPKAAPAEFGTSSLRLHVRGKGHPCNAYELWPEQFLAAEFRDSFSQKSTGNRGNAG